MQIKSGDTVVVIAGKNKFTIISPIKLNTYTAPIPIVNVQIIFSNKFSLNAFIFSLTKSLNTINKKIAVDNVINTL